jgi:branched-chain amino acid transport system permease protein
MAKMTVVRGSSQYRMYTALGLGVTLLVIALLPVLLSDFLTFQFTMAFLWAMGVLSLNMLTGWSGQISLGHSALFGIGAYTTVMLAGSYGWNPLLTVPMAGLVSFLFGFAIGIPALRLAGLYLALMTLAIGVAFVPLIRRFKEYTGGSMGVSIKSKAFPKEMWGLSRDQYLYYLVVIAGIILFALARNLLKSRVGRAITAMRDNEIPAQTMGIYPARYKTLIFATSAMFAGLAGSLYGFVIRFAAPYSFTLTLAITLLAALVVGGIGTFAGAVIGGIFIQFVPYYAEQVNQGLAGLVFGVIIIVIMLAAPLGFMGFVKKWRAKIVNVVDPSVVRSEGAA